MRMHNADINSFFMEYNAQTGTIDCKSDLGYYTDFKYHSNKPHAVASLENLHDATPSFPTRQLAATYTDFKKLKTLSEGNRGYAITYGVDEQRKRTVYSENGGYKQVRYYMGDYEVESNNVRDRKIHYLSGGDGLAAIYVQWDDGRDSLLYAYTDNLGSIIALTDVNHKVLEHYAYNPWGERKNPSNWKQNDSRTSWITNRGYTGHEHLDQFGVINMNGRVYDPLTAMFLSPDPFVQAPNNWLNYNRYGYCYNNPFKYTDPSGEIAWFVPVIMGAALGAYTGGVIANEDPNPLNWNYSSGQTWRYMVGGAVVGGVSGGLSGAIAASGMPMANTAAMMSGSFINSVGMNLVTDGKVPVMMNFGVASYNFTSGEWGYFGKKGNNGWENFGYALGAFGNLKDINDLINASTSNLYTQTKYEDGRFDAISHSGIQSAEGEKLMSYGPASDSKFGKRGLLNFALEPKKGTPDYSIEIALSKKSGDLNLNKFLFRGLKVVAKNASFYQGITTNCVNWSSVGLLLNGIPNIGIHPFILHASIALYNTGVYNSIANQLVSYPY